MSVIPELRTLRFLKIIFITKLCSKSSIKDVWDGRDLIFVNAKLMLNFISVLMIFDYRGKCLWEGNSSWVAHVCTPYSALDYVLEDVYTTSLEQRAGFLLFCVGKITSPSGGKKEQVCVQLFRKAWGSSCDTNPLHVTPGGLGNQEELTAI